MKELYSLLLLVCWKHRPDSMVLACGGGPSAGGALGPYIRQHQVLSYDTQELHRQHQRVSRSTRPQELSLDFTAFQRRFSLRLRRDANSFASPLSLQAGGAPGPADLSHLYTGSLDGEQHSWCQGAVLQGLFEGSIHTVNNTFHVEPLHRYSSPQGEQHSIIYRQEDLVPPTGPAGFCGSKRLKLLAQTLRPDKEAAVSRSRKSVDESKTTCLLHLHVDHLYYRKFRSVEAVVAQVSSYIRAVNDIYDKVDFGGTKLINFKVQTEPDEADPLQREFVGPEKLLSLFSERNWGNFCLSYLLTDRDYSGVLGLAWEGKTGNWGGICSQHTTLRDGRSSSLNTGLVTLQNYGHYLPPRHMQLTLAHELGHSLGAPHDEGTNCGGGGAGGGKGRFLMFPEATDEVQENNDKFSSCSMKSISTLLRSKKDSCFVESDQPICGNHLVEEGEQCDVGQAPDDPCCFSALEPAGLQCHLKAGRTCSPSQGPCCAAGCVFKAPGTPCADETECRGRGVCSGLSPLCPAPLPKDNLTTCSLGSRVCLGGDCADSLCVKYGLQQCHCPGGSMKDKCHMCCQEQDQPETCASTTSSVLTRHFQRRSVPLVPGAPCHGRRGYCDHFRVCRVLDADGPIARLKNAYFHLDQFEDLAEWMKAQWWAILLAILLVSAGMGGIICLCGRTLDTRETRPSSPSPWTPERLDPSPHHHGYQRD